MGLLTEFLAAANKYEFLDRIKQEQRLSDAYMFGLTQSLLQGLTDLVGNDLALNLSDARDRLRRMEEAEWEKLKKRQADREGGE